jgi:hypothetical protein
MDWLITYLVFALSTSICAWLFLYRPVYIDICQLGVKNSFTTSPLISALTFIVLTTIAAPAIFTVLFSNERSEDFKRGIFKEMAKSK